MEAQDLLDAAEIHRLKGEIWKARLIWEDVVHNFPETEQQRYAKEQLQKNGRDGRNVFIEASRGQRALGEVFWMYYVIPQIAAVLIFALIAGLGFRDAARGFVFLVSLAAIPYTAWIVAALWRCAPNGPPIFGLIVRGWVLVVVLILLLTLTVAIFG